MAKQAISVTLDADNLTWLKGRAGAAGLRSVSELLDQLVTAARESGGVGPSRVGRRDHRHRSRAIRCSRAPTKRARACSTRPLGRPLMVKEVDGRSTGSRHAKEAAAWLSHRPPSPTRTRWCSTPPAAGKLGPRAAAFFDRCERRDAILYVPTVVIWECSLLARVSRINLRRTVRAFFDDLFSNPAYQPLDVTPEQIYLADELRFTRDPFDALICATARTHRPAADHA